jgi:hypothetical protein
MLDEQLWLRLSEEDKIEEIQDILNKLLNIENGLHELHGTSTQGKIAAIKKELQGNLFKIIDIENAT